MITAAAVVSSYTAVFAEDAVSFDKLLNAQTAVLDAVTDADKEAAAEEIVTEDIADAELTGTAALNSALASGWCGDDLQWTLDSSGQLLIYGSGPMYSYSGTVTGTHAPWYNYRSAITSISFSHTSNSADLPISVGDYAFLDLTELTSVSLYKYVSGIGDYAFKNCSSLRTVSFSDNVSDIGRGAFTNCSSLRSISLPDGISRLNAYMFNNCSALQYVYIPDGVSFIDKYAFYNCTALRDIYIPFTVSSVEPYTFANCISLSSLTLPSSLSSIKEYAFSGCRSLDNVTVPNSVYTIENNAFENCYSLKSITLSKNISKISDYTFSGCSALETLALPENVSKIGTYAFNGCNKLRCISLPDFLSVIGTSAFHNCSALTHIHIPYNTDWRYYSGRGELPTVSDYYININADGTCPSGVMCPLGMISWGSIITSQPNDFTVVKGSIASFDVTAVGTGLSYQWQYSPDGIVWNNCTSASAHTSSYSFIASLSHDGFRYRCIVADSYGNSYTSNPATLHVLENITISAQPEDRSAPLGGSAEFSVTAAGTGLIYQWQYSTDGGSWVNIGTASASADTLTVSPLTLTMNGRYYRCVITDAYGNSVNTDTAQLIITSTSLPSDITVEELINCIATVNNIFADALPSSDYRVLTEDELKAIEAVLDFDYRK